VILCPCGSRNVDGYSGSIVVVESVVQLFVHWLPTNAPSQYTTTLIEQELKRSSLNWNVYHLVSASSALPSVCADRTLAGGRHRAFQADLGTVEGVRALHADIVRELGPIDILFVNHGIIGHMLGRDGNIEDLDFSIFARTWQNNTAPAFLVSIIYYSLSCLMYRDADHSSSCLN
jgi:hypothetical protein